MATTRLGVTGPMAAYGAFAAKELSTAVSASRLPLMGAGGVMLWFLLHAWR